MNLTTHISNKKFDAIVIGTGISGGWAAKELCEAGLNTLVLERGRDIEHIIDYPTALKETWDFDLRAKLTVEEKKLQQKQGRTGFATNKNISHWFVNDLEHPYGETKRFDWIRGYHVGGRSITWGRQALRMSDLDFEANLKENIAIDWPIRYRDLEKWYSKVETFIGVSGENLGLKHLPDGCFLPPMPLNKIEIDFKKHLNSEYTNRHLTIGRFTNITDDTPFEGRSKCLYRDKCVRGCPFGAYFSSNSSTLPAAKRTGNMTLIADSIVHEIVYDDKQKKATGVKVINAKTNEKIQYSAKIIFSCASTIASTSILLQSKSNRFPNGLGNDSGELGHNLMDHHFKVGAQALVNGFEKVYYKGRRPASFHIPRFRNLDGNSENLDFVRGYSFQGSASRLGWSRAIKELSFGKELKKELLKPGPWRIGIVGFGECLPYHDNKITLDYSKTDKWNLPLVNFNCEFRENEQKMRKDMKEQAVHMLKSAGYSNVKGFDNPCFPGIAIHEMGTARMGNNPETSVLNKYNQIHSVPNVFVTDGSCMTSSGNQNPSLTYMALTARAVNHAVSLLKEKRI